MVDTAPNLAEAKGPPGLYTGWPFHVAARGDSGSALLGIECRSTRKGSARCSIPARHLKFALMMEGQLDFQPIARAMGQFADDEASA
jgi:hypothetical protein